MLKHNLLFTTLTLILIGTVSKSNCELKPTNLSDNNSKITTSGTTNQSYLNQFYCWAWPLTQNQKDEILYSAASKGDINSVKEAINNGANINYAKTKDCGFTALHIASAQGHLNVVVFLVDMGADINQMANGYHLFTPLNTAIDHDSLDIVKYLAANPKIEFDRIPHRPLDQAIYKGKTEIVRILLNSGTDITDFKGKFVTSLKSFNIESAQLLLRAQIFNSLKKINFRPETSLE